WRLQATIQVEEPISSQTFYRNKPPHQLVDDAISDLQLLSLLQAGEKHCQCRLFAKLVRFYGVGRGCGLGRGLGVGIGLGVGVAVGVAVGVGVAVAVGVDVGVGVVVAVGVDVAVGVGVGVAPCAYLIVA